MSLSEMLAIEHTLQELVGPEHRDLVNKLDGLYGDAVAEAENRLLRLVGSALIEHELGDVFEAIYAQVMRGCLVEPGDARAFLFREVGDAPTT